MTKGRIYDTDGSGAGGRCGGEKLQCSWRTLHSSCVFLVLRECKKYPEQNAFPNKSHECKKNAYECQWLLHLYIYGIVTGRMIDDFECNIIWKKEENLIVHRPTDPHIICYCYSGHYYRMTDDTQSTDIRTCRIIFSCRVQYSVIYYNIPAIVKEQLPGSY